MAKILKFPDKRKAGLAELPAGYTVMQVMAGIIVIDGEGKPRLRYDEGDKEWKPIL